MFVAQKLIKINTHKKCVKNDCFYIILIEKGPDQKKFLILTIRFFAQKFIISNCHRIFSRGRTSMPNIWKNI